MAAWGGGPCVGGRELGADRAVGGDVADRVAQVQRVGDGVVGPSVGGWPSPPATDRSSSRRPAPEAGAADAVERPQAPAWPTTPPGWCASAGSGCTSHRSSRSSQDLGRVQRPRPSGPHRACDGQDRADEFGPLAVRPTGGALGPRSRPPAARELHHGVRQFHGCYSVGDDELWGVVRRRKSAANTKAALRSIRARDGEPVYVILDNLSAHNRTHSGAVASHGAPECHCRVIRTTPGHNRCANTSLASGKRRTQH